MYSESSVTNYENLTCNLPNIKGKIFWDVQTPHHSVNEGLRENVKATRKDFNEENHNS